MSAPTQFEVQNSDTFVNDFFNNMDTLTEPKQPVDPNSPIIQPIIEAEKKVEGAASNTKSAEEMLKDLNLVDDSVEEDSLLSNTEDFANKLIEENLIYTFEDGSLPKNTKELVEALKQSNAHNFSLNADRVLTERYESLPDPLKLIFDYAQKGVNNISELREYINEVQDLEGIQELDVTKESDFENIVARHLANTGLSQEAIRLEIEDLKDSNKLKLAAERYFPAIEQKQKQVIKDLENNKRIEEDRRKEYITGNAQNVRYFLENSETELELIIDKQVKANVFELAANPIGIDPQGTAVYGWQQYIDSLQNGTETQYKEFIEIMTFLADKNKYNKSKGQVITNNNNLETFKKIKVPTSSVMNSSSNSNNVIQNNSQRKQEGPQRW
jgi:hypothetical protein